MIKYDFIKKGILISDLNCLTGFISEGEILSIFAEDICPDIYIVKYNNKFYGIDKKYINILDDYKDTSIIGGDGMTYNDNFSMFFTDNDLVEMFPDTFIGHLEISEVETL